MSFWSRARAQTFLVVGLSELTGLPAAKLLERHGVRYKVSDSASRAELAPRLAQLSVADSDVFTGPQLPAQLEGIDCVLIAPGVPRTIPLLVEARRRGVPVLVDVDFAYELIAGKRIVAITGTDGKTTTTTLTGELLSSLGRVVVGGNIGTSVYSMLDEIAAADWLVLELSSFMLEELTRFRPHFAAILNVAQDHIDRYPSLDAYAAAKQTIVRHCQPNDVLVLNVDDARLAAFRPAHVGLRQVSRRDLRDGDLCVGGARYRYAECGLSGQQNVINILVAATIAHEAGVAPEAIMATLRRFRGLPHRMEHVGRFGGVDAYNDSKASNAHAVKAALLNFESNVVLILGGRDKGLDFSILRDQTRRLRCLVCYGVDGPKLRDALAFEPSHYTYCFDDAVKLAARQCRPGDVLLMSPGCTSWDQYRWYGERGDAFRELARRYLNERHDDDAGDAAEEAHARAPLLDQAPGAEEP
jgi:UDP-N-acetylmuramoylalanine--D-glutamate ligase